jgi:hypothetical protein
VQKFFFDMKDGAPLRDRVGIEFKSNREPIEHSKELAQHFRDDNGVDCGCWKLSDETSTETNSARGRVYAQGW